MTTQEQPSSNETVLKHVEQCREHYDALRKRLYFILARWYDHNLTREDNYYSFARLDLMRIELDEIERLLRKASTSTDIKQAS